MMHSLIYSTLNWLIWSYVITIQIAKCTGSGCSTLDGTWYNELGSMMNVTHAENGELTGTYMTAVERDKGYLDTNHSQIFGTSPYSKPGSVFGFSVMWRGGLSMTSWTGQCLVCADGGEEVLETSWLLKSKVPGCLDSWKSTMIGQDTFKRYDFARTSNQPKRVKRQSPEPPANTGTEVTSVDDARPCKSLSGYWYNQVGSEMHITTHYDNQVRGEYRMTREQCNGVSGSTHSNVYGASNNTDVFSTVFLFVVWNNGEAITGWVGQCHVCGENNTETLLLTWLLRSQIDSCHDNSLSTNYGEARFTRKPQISGGHKPGEFGEKSGTTVCGSGSRIVFQPIVTLLVGLSSIRIFIHSY